MSENEQEFSATVVTHPLASEVNRSILEKLRLHPVLSVWLDPTMTS